MSTQLILFLLALASIAGGISTDMLKTKQSDFGELMGLSVLLVVIFGTVFFNHITNGFT